MDRQVKIGGNRVEINEVESVILENPTINTTAVIPMSDSYGTTQLVCFLPKISVDFSSIRKYLQTRLPAYMVPKYFFSLEKLPLTHTGKIDRKKLSEIAKKECRPMCGTSASCETNGLLDIAERILGIRDCSIPFGELGIDSLQLARFHIELEKYGIVVPFACLKPESSLQTILDMVSKPKED